MSIVVLSSSDVDAVISKIDLTEAMQLMATVFSTLSLSPKMIMSPLRTTIHMSNHTTLFMPSRILDQSSQLVGDMIGEHGRTGMKVVSVPSGTAVGQGLPATTILMDETSGRVKAIINATRLTALRTAAGSLLATSLLYGGLEVQRNLRPENLVLFGAGLQIYFHGTMLMRYYPSIKLCTIINRSKNSRLLDLVGTLKVEHPTVDMKYAWTDGSGDAQTTSVADSVRGADIICTATSSTEPLFPSEWVTRGTHLNLVGSYTSGMREVDDQLVQRAGIVVVDSKSACLEEAGELMRANGGPAVMDIGMFCEAQVEERRSRIESIHKAGDVTIFKSVGLGVQDVAIGSLVARKATELGLGTVTPF